MSYDSTADTTAHINRVKELLHQITETLNRRGEAHDASKLLPPEKEGFDTIKEKLKDLKYGSPDYRAALRGNLKPTLDHHYANNSHHPEFYENGIDGMSLLDLIEMFADWKAAGERHTDGDIYKSIEINSERFNISYQLKKILLNTAKELNY